MRNKGIVAVLLLCVVNAFVVAETSQETEVGRRWFIGVEASYAYNTLYAENGYRPFSQYESGHGFDIGVPVRFVIFDWLAVQSGVQFIQKKYSFTRTDDDRIYRNYTNSFLEFPLLAHLSIKLGPQDLRFFISAGAEIGVWIVQHMEGSQYIVAIPGYGDSRGSEISYQSYSENIEWNSKRDNRFEAALLGGVGIQYSLKPCTFYIEGRYHYGLTDLQKSYQRNQSPRINDTITVGAGVLFNADIFNVFRRVK